MVKLRNCPFCNGFPSFYFNHIGNERSVYVMCDRCEARINSKSRLVATGEYYFDQSNVETLKRALKLAAFDWNGGFTN